MAGDQLKEAAMAMFAFLHADRIRFGNKIKEIEESIVLGLDSFPIDMDLAYKILADTKN